MANVASEMWLQEELVDQMNMKIFEKYRAELEIENSFDEFFEPKKKMEIFIFDSSSKLTKLY